MRFSAKRHKCLMTAMFFIAVAMLVFSGFALASGEEHGEHGPKGWVSTDTYRVMNFAVLFIALFLLLRKPMTNALNARIKGIEDQLAELEAKKAEAEKQLASYNEKLAKLDEEAQKIVEEYIQQGNDAKDKILQAAQGAAVKLEEQAKRNIEHEFKQAKIRLQAEVMEKALNKAEEIIKEKITADDQDRLVDEYLDKVVA